MASGGDAELILNVDATVARPTSSTAEPTMSDMAAQLQEAKAAALAAADRMAALLKQMEVMEATAAKRRLAELAIQERIATAGATASAAAASASVAAASTGSAEAAPAAAAPPSQTVRFPSSESGAERDSSGDSKRGRQITMTDVYGEDDDKAGQARACRPDRPAQRAARAHCSTHRLTSWRLAARRRASTRASRGSTTRARSRSRDRRRATAAPTATLASPKRRSSAR